MKRIILGLLLALGITAYAGPAAAVVLRTREIGWASNTATTLNPVLTTRKGFNGSAADTTMGFSLFGVSMPTAAIQGTSGKDSVTVAYVVFSTDSTVAVTNTLSSVSYSVQASGDQNTWATIYSNVSNAISASGDQHFAIPLWLNIGQGNNATGTKTSPLLTAPYLRILFTGCTGNMFAMRCRLLYWAEPITGPYPSP